jgi:hypothetical protein
MHIGTVVVANGPTSTEPVLSQVFLHVFALFRLIEDVACVWGSLATRIVARVSPFFISSSLIPFYLRKATLVIHDGIS